MESRIGATRVETDAQKGTPEAGMSHAEQPEVKNAETGGRGKQVAAGAVGAVAGAAGAIISMGFVVPGEAPETPETPETSTAGTSTGTMPSVDDFDGQHIPEATGVNDNMSFSEAFAAARAETGAGGVFFWRGGVYGTYYRDEWSQLSPEYKEAFSNYPYRQTENTHADSGHTPEEPAVTPTGGKTDAEQEHVAATSSVGDTSEHVAQPEAGQEHVAATSSVGDTSEHAEQPATASDEVEAGQEHVAATSPVGDTSEHVAQPEAGQEHVAATSSVGDTSEHAEQPATASDEVEVLGVHYTEVDGHTVAVAPISVNGNEALLVDVDTDGIFDYALTDSGTETPDVHDISEYQITYDDVNNMQQAAQQPQEV